MDNVHCEGLFPTPILTVVRPEPYTTEEHNFVKNLSLLDGNNNQVSVCTNVLDYPELRNLKNFFIECLNFFTEKVYLASSDELDISISWVNTIKPGKSHAAHKHKNAILSGVYYFEPTHESPLIVISPLENHNNHDYSIRRDHNHFNSQEWILPTDGNTLIMFPAWLQHRVPVNNTNKTRYSIAWNAWFKKNRSYGFEDCKTYIKN